MHGCLLFVWKPAARMCNGWTSDPLHGESHVDQPYDPLAKGRSVALATGGPRRRGDLAEPDTGAEQAPCSVPRRSFHAVRDERPLDDPAVQAGAIQRT